MKSVLIIDNFDSFTFNLAYEFEKRGCEVSVYRNTISAEGALEKAKEMAGEKLIVLSPGPSEPHTAGCCIDLVRKNDGEIPLLGICLGHQCIVEAYGGIVEGADEIVHGKSSALKHDGKGLFAGISTRFLVGRYHSLVTKSVPEGFILRANIDDMVMAIEHKEQPIYGVQFHPESILTAEGGKIFDNVLNMI